MKKCYFRIETVVENSSFKNKSFNLKFFFFCWVKDYSYKKIIKNLDILTNEERFADINKSVFDAIDTDNSGTLEKEEVEVFVKG